MNLKFRSALACISAAIAIAGAAPVQAQKSPPAPPDVPAMPSRWSPRFDGSGVSHLDTLVPFSERGSVELGLVSGSIKVSAWNRNQVRVIANAPDGSTLDFDATSSHVDLGVHGPNVRRRWSGETGNARYDVAYDVTVPTGTRLTLSSISGGINASGVHGGIDANTVSGAVAVRDAAASVAIESVSGNVTVVDVAGDVRAEAVSGTITVSGVAGTVSAENVSGRTEVSNVRGTRVRAGAVSGDVTFTGVLNPAGRYDFHTHSGRLVLQLAGGASAAVNVDTYSGSVMNDYPGAVRRSESDPDDARTSYRYTMGRGDARVSIETFSGRVQISQGNP